MKWKTGVLLGSLFISAFIAQAQNSVGIGVATPNKNAVLELISPGNNQGLLVPKLTTAQRTANAFTSALSTKENGLMVFDQDENKFYYWEATQWKAIGTGNPLTSGDGITITGTTISTVPQDLVLNGSTLTITGNTSPTPINLSAFTGTNTDDQSLSFDATTGALTITRISGGDQSVTIMPTGAAGGDLSGTFPNPTIASGFSASKIAPGTLNQVLTTTSGGTQWATLPAFVTSVATGTGLTGGPITNTGTIALANTAVTAGTYGTASQVASITVDAQGRITNATSTPITGTLPGGAAGGDLAGTFPNPTIATGLTVNKLAAGTLSQVLTTTAGGVAWAGLPASVTNVATGAGLTGGPITNTGTIALANTAVTAGTYGTASQVASITVDAQGRITNASSTPITGTLPGGAAGGDLAGTFPNPTIATGLTVNKLAAGTLSQVLTTTAGGVAWAGLPASVTSVATGTGLTGGPILNTGTIALANTAVTAGTYGTATSVPTIIVDAQGRITGAGNTNITGVTPGGAAGGDLTGTFPNPTVANGLAVSKLASGALNQVLTTTAGGTVWQNLPLFGTVTSITAGTGLTGGAITTAGTINLNNTGVAAATYGSATTSATIGVDLQGRIVTASSTPITGTLPGGAAAGDLTGTYPNPTVATSAITSAKILDGTILNADINNLANIDVAKLGPGTNNQILITSGTSVQWAAPGSSALITAPGTRNLVGGDQAGAPAAAGTDNSIFGQLSGFAGATGFGNVSMGSQAGQNNAAGGLNVLIGWRAGLAGANSSFNGNTFIGARAGLVATNAPNTFIGERAGMATNTGTQNVFVGNGAGLANTTGGQNTLIGYDANISAPGVFQNATAIGYAAVVDANNKVRLGNTAVATIEGQVPFTNPSDVRLKANINNVENGLDLIMKLRPVSYTMKNSTDKRLNWGFIAQEVQSLVGDNNSVVTVGESKEKMLGLRYTDFIAPLVKAVQEQQIQIAELNKKLADSSKKISDLEASARDLEAEKVKIANLMAEVEKMKRAIGLKADARK